MNTMNTMAIGNVQGNRAILPHIVDAVLWSTKVANCFARAPR